MFPNQRSSGPLCSTTKRFLRRCGIEGNPPHARPCYRSSARALADWRVTPHANNDDQGHDDNRVRVAVNSSGGGRAHRGATARVGLRVTAHANTSDHRCDQWRDDSRAGTDAHRTGSRRAHRCVPTTAHRPVPAHAHTTVGVPTRPHGCWSPQSLPRYLNRQRLWEMLR